MAVAIKAVALAAVVCLSTPAQAAQTRDWHRVDRPKGTCVRVGHSAAEAVDEMRRQGDMVSTTAHKNDDGSIHYVEIEARPPMASSPGYLYMAPNLAECQKLLQEMQKNGYAQSPGDLD
jgi:hypothetical protein